MSLFPAYFGARKSADDDLAPVPEQENETRADIFNLIPPRADQNFDRPPAELSQSFQPSEGPRQIEGRNVHPVAAMDLTRLAIDESGRLYWDGKPVEVQRRLMMSRSQVIGTSVIALFIVCGAVSSAIQATATVHDWACRAGWASECGAAGPTPVAPSTLPSRPDIPL